MSKRSLFQLSATARKHLLDGSRFLAKRDFSNAERSATFAMALAPEQPQPVAFLGNVLRRKGSIFAAVTVLREGVRRHGDDFALRRELANALAANGDLDESVQHFRVALSLGEEGETWFELGSVHDRNGQGVEAIQAARSALDILPDHLPSRFLLASGLMSAGRIEESAAEYRWLARHSRQRAKAWFGLLDLKTVRLSAEELSLLEKLEATSTNDTDRILSGFALGRALEAAGRFDDAFTAFVKANGLVRGKLQWSATSHTSNVEKIARVFGWSEEDADRASETCSVIFIVGMPRSGSTVIEQILSAHPDVVAAGELSHVDAVLAAESTRRGKSFSDWAPLMADSDWRRLGQEYLTRARRFQGRRAFTDKLPSNWRYVGAIQRMLPGARFVFTDRNLLETCWSCYKQMFSPGSSIYSNDWAELVHYALDCRWLWDAWKHRFPDQCRTQSHEALQTHPELQTRELLAFCDLEYNEACLEFHVATNNVRTASAAQVRQPLLRDTASARRYGKTLSSFVEELVAISVERGVH